MRDEKSKRSEAPPPRPSDCNRCRHRENHHSMRLKKGVLTWTCSQCPGGVCTG